MRSMRAGIAIGVSVVFMAIVVGPEAIFRSSAQPPVFSYSPDPQQRNIEYGLAKELYAALEAWMQSKSTEDGAACDAIVDRLTATGTPSVEMWFLAAKVAEMRGQYPKAMGSLREIVEHHAQDRAPGFNVTAGASANLWLGRLERDRGDANAAVRAFANAAGMLEGSTQAQYLAALCHMYRAEVLASLLSKTADAKTAYADAAEVCRRGGRHSDRSPEALIGMWVRWNMAALDGDARREPCPSRLQPLFAPVLAAVLSLNGILASPRVDFYSGTSEARCRWPLAFLRDAVESVNSNLDRDMLRVELATIEREYKAYANAIAALDGVKEESFLYTFAQKEKERTGSGGAGK